MHWLYTCCKDASYHMLAVSQLLCCPWAQVFRGGLRMMHGCTDQWRGHLKFWLGFSMSAYQNMLDVSNLRKSKTCSCSPYPISSYSTTCGISVKSKLLHSPISPASCYHRLRLQVLNSFCLCCNVPTTILLHSLEQWNRQGMCDLPQSFGGKWHSLQWSSISNSELGP